MSYEPGCCLNRRHSQPRSLMVGQTSYYTLKNFPKLADFPPLLAVLGSFRVAPISAGELKTVPALIFEKHLLQNEVEGNGIDPAENHTMALALGNYWRQVKFDHCISRVVGHLVERITIG